MLKVSVETYIEQSGGSFSTDLFNKGQLRTTEMELTDLLRWTKSQLIVIADQVLAEEQANGFDKKPVTIVDGRKNKSVQEVSPLGSIEFVSRQQFGTVLLDAYNALLELSKVKTGRYKASHYVFLNGVQKATDLSSLENWLKTNPSFKENDLVRIVNIQPYGRRLELLGVTAGRTNPRREDRGRRKGIKTGVTIKKPNGAYQLATRRVKNKYKQNSTVNFTFIPGSLLGIAGSFKRGRAGKNSAGRTYLYPSMVFKVQERGIF